MTRYLAVVILLLCCQVVGANPDNMESWRKRLGAPTESTRQAAISQLIELGPGGWTWFQALADDSNPRVRAALSNGLGLLPDRVSRPILEKFLEDPDGAVRAAAVRCLLLDSPEPHVAVLRQAAASNPSSLDDGLRYWTAVYVHRELDRLLPEDHFVLGTYPKMFKRLAPLGDWVKNPLLRIIRHWPTWPAKHSDN
jgi:hypothetical protein